MNVLYIGTGFVGVCSAAVSADSGHNVLAYDIDEEKVRKLGSEDKDEIESCIHENGLGELLIRNKNLINFTTDYKRVEEFLDNCDAVFMCLPTPEIGETGESNLSYYFDASEKLAKSLVKRNAHNPSSAKAMEGKQEKYVVIINKSTVPVDMVDKTENIFNSAGVKNFGVVSNPEFLVEGKAVQDSLRPDRVVVGAWEEKDFKIMSNLYQRFYGSSTVKYIEVNPKEAAASKLLANFYLFNRLAVCFDVVGRTCESFDDLKFENIRNILTTDPRIGSWGFYDSLYAGGSCFIKDARSLSHQLKAIGSNSDLVDDTYSANKRQLDFFIGRAKNEAKLNWHNKKVAILGLSFKQDTNDIRNSPSIDIMNFLEENKVEKINIYDPAAMGYFKQVFPESEAIDYKENESESIKDVDVIIIATDWPQFRGLADTIIGELKNKPLIMDGRRILQHRYDDLQNAGFDIIAVGSPFIKGK